MAMQGWGGGSAMPPGQDEEEDEQQPAMQGQMPPQPQAPMQPSMQPPMKPAMKPAMGKTEPAAPMPPSKRGKSMGEIFRSKSRSTMKGKPEVKKAMPMKKSAFKIGGK